MRCIPLLQVFELIGPTLELKVRLLNVLAR